MGVKSFIIEDGLALAKSEIRDEVKHLFDITKLHRDKRARDALLGQVRAVVVTFLARTRPADADIGVLTNGDAIGQAVLITFPAFNRSRKVETRSYVYEATMRLPSKRRPAPPPCDCVASAGGGQPAAPRAQEDPYEELLNNHVPVSRFLPIWVHHAGSERRLEFRATYFCQQNGVSSICGHCAVRMLVRTSSETKLTVPKLNEDWRYKGSSRSTVSSSDIRRALQKCQLEVKSYRFDHRASQNHEDPPGGGARAAGGHTAEQIWNRLSQMAESGVPALFIHSSESRRNDHVVPIFGHTFNSDEWHPIASTRHRNGNSTTALSTSWVDHLVIHDDLLGPYYCLSRAGLRLAKSPSRAPAGVAGAAAGSAAPTGFQQLIKKLLPGDHQPGKSLHPKKLLVVVPKNVSRSPIDIEAQARQRLAYVERIILEQGLTVQGRWWDLFNDRRERRVLRTILITKAEYMESLWRYHTAGGRIFIDTLTADQRAFSEALNLVLPEKFWVTEVSLPNMLLASRSKLGEFLIDPSRNPRNDEELARAIYAFRMPSLLGINYDDAEGRSQFAINHWPEHDLRPILGVRNKNIW
ncbi:MAG: hypothetical protein V4574_08260 [Pseudomonadota bacterium]